MELANQLSFILPYAVSIGLIVAAFILLFQKKNIKKFLIGSLITVFIVKIISVAAQNFFYYYLLKQNAFGQILLEQNSNFFLNQVKESAQILAINFGFALIVLIIFYLVFRWQKKPWLGETTPFTASFLVISLGNVNFLLALMTGLIFSLIYLVYLALIKKKNERVIIDPFILAAGLVFLVIVWFPFYAKILSYLRLI